MTDRQFYLIVGGQCLIIALLLLAAYITVSDTRQKTAEIQATALALRDSLKPGINSRSSQGQPSASFLQPTYPPCDLR